MIEKYTEILKKLKEDRLQLPDFLYKEGLDKDGNAFDENSTKRFQLLIALQYNPNLRDEMILVELFKAEIERHKKAPFQGLYPALRLSAYLVSNYADHKHVTLFLAAKQANFDTHCGFDYQFLVSAGIHSTYHSIENEKPEIKESFYEYVGSVDHCYISDNELEQWKKQLNEEYPGTLNINGILDEIDLAIDLEETEILKEKVNEWRSSKNSWTEKELKQFIYFQGIIKDVSAQIWANEELLDLKLSDWDCASQLHSLSDLLVKNKQYVEAWNRIKDAQKYLKRISDWKSIGLGRFIIENAFDVVIGSNDQKDVTAKEAFKWASKNVKTMKNLHLNLLEKIIKACELMGDAKLGKKFIKILEAKQGMLDKILNR